MRYQKLDALRWVAIIGMILFHFNYILENVFGEMIFHFSDTFWFLLGRTVAIIFILVSGISFFLSAQKKGTPELIRVAIKRFMFLAAIALAITVVTYGFFYEQRISFGIIHFFALASLAVLLFVRFGGWNIPLGMVMLVVWYYFRYFSPDTYLFIPLGLYPRGYYSADYYPLIPWFGYYIIGYGTAYWLKKRGFFDDIFSGSFIGGAALAFMGKHSLLLYSIHVPIMYGILSIFYWP